MLTPNEINNLADEVRQQFEKEPLNSTELGYAMVSFALTFTADQLRTHAANGLTAEQVATVATRLDAAAETACDLGDAKANGQASR